MKWLITGGAGFIGCNAAQRLLHDQYKVILLDNLSRKGARENLQWLSSQGNFEFVEADVRNFQALQKLFMSNPDIDVVLHLAGQVAVTSSVKNPREDLETNLIGTFNLCETLRQFSPQTILLNASTNKVYGQTEDLPITSRNNRYEYVQSVNGVSENHPVDFHSPYGCSKGAAEQYVRDYSRIYGLKTVSFRQSCIYGPHQFGIEDQGWVAWFIIAAVTGAPLTLYGDGKQVRDVLWVDDLIDCYLHAARSIEKTSGKIYNIGGGPDHTLSLLELLNILEKHLGRKISYKTADWRPGDQRVYISDISQAEKDFGWKPRVSRDQGILALLNWVQDES